MTPDTLDYLTYLALTLLPPAVILGAAVRRRAADPRRVLLGTVAVALIAVVYTVPWDGALIRRGVWWYGTGVTRVRFGSIPLGEYCFFVLQPLLTGLWLGVAVPRVADAPADRFGARLAGVWGWGLVALAGALLARFASWSYLGSILMWAAPVLALLGWVGGPALRRHARPLVAAVAVPTLYLWIVDRVALGLNLWSISPRYTTGIGAFGLPVEEATFFLVTNLLVVHGVLLFRWVLARNDAGGVAYALAGLVPQASRLRTGARELPWR
jgi:hypothetical protein